MWGRLHLRALEAEGLDTRMVSVMPECATGAVVAIVDGSGERTFLACRLGCADTHLKLDVQAMAALRAKVLFVSGPAIAEGAESYDTVLELLAASCGEPRSEVWFDPNVRSPDGQVGSATRERYWEVLKATDVFLPNESELLQICEGESVAEGVEHALSLGVKEVWVKRGEGSVLWASALAEVREEYAVTAVTPVDTTGAGDAFSAGMIYARLRGWDPGKSAALASAAAAFSVQRAGAIPSFARLDQLR
jgi:sugar/nucleoside kinase (ribokinase family)